MSLGLIGLNIKQTVPRNAKRYAQQLKIIKYTNVGTYVEVVRKGWDAKVSKPQGTNAEVVDGGVEAVEDAAEADAG